MTMLARINGLGICIPPDILTNEKIATFVDTTPEWIETRTGIQERHIVQKNVMGSDLALEASLAALKSAGKTPEDLTHIIYATCTPDCVCPPTACILESKLGIQGRAVFDINAVCSGFVNSLELARCLINMHPSACILLVAAETLSHRCNWEDRTTCVLFGDGAGAAIITGSPADSSFPEAQVLDLRVNSNGDIGDLLTIGLRPDGPYKLGDTIGPEYFIQMQGREVFKHAVRNMEAVCNEILAANNHTINDVDVLIPHQANFRIIEAVGSRLGIAPEKTFCNVHKYGNTSAASVPIALTEALQEGFIKKGNLVLLTSFGGGFTWGAALLKF